MLLNRLQVGYHRRVILCQTSRGDVFIDRDDDITFYKKSGKRVVESVLGNDTSFGLVGSDVVEEWFYDEPNLDVEEIAPMTNRRGDALRFAIIASEDGAQSNQYVTSYPMIAKRILGEDVELIEAGGSIEAEVQDLRVPGFELVQSGDSVQANNLVIVADNLARVSLCRVQRKYNTEN